MKQPESVTAQYSSPDTGVSAAATLWLVGPVEDDGRREPVFEQFPWPTHRVRNVRQAALHLPCGHACVVVCEQYLADGDWKDVLEVTASLPNPPPLIVTSLLADEHLWAEVLNLGGFDVLAKPLNQQEVRRVLNFAWVHWADRAYPARRFETDTVRRGDVGKCSAA